MKSASEIWISQVAGFRVIAKICIDVHQRQPPGKNVMPTQQLKDFAIGFKRMAEESEHKAIQSFICGSDWYEFEARLIHRFVLSFGMLKLI